ncbi:chorismate synthase [Oscillibacter sp. MSJ-2]|uniref:Chorismate synthase n=1 Tax=Dysosmobacter acutus TaxID=2841504 RepID=A0ABS6F6F1_9FIRM|nr:chorismate synthase [Dysosmobacter acutus]MBU5625879.1 chorismate synthase [Dysosmobacter acutus]
MTSFELGRNFTVQVFGQSHADAIGAVVDGLPAGKRIDLDEVFRFMGRRAPGKNGFSTARREADRPEVLSGLVDGCTTGAPVCAVIRNENVRSGDYANVLTVPRPGHADFPAYVKYGGKNDVRGGGAFSGRMTAPLCFAGALCLQLLRERGIEVFAHIRSVAGMEDAAIDPCCPDLDALRAVAEKEFPTLSDAAGKEMRSAIAQAKGEGDSVGGVIECVAVGLPVGLGSHMFGGVENRLSAALFGIPAVRGVEFGSGFAGCGRRGSENNDPFRLREGRVVTTKNDHGGVLGGMTSGMPLVFRVGVKPTPSIAKPQQSVDLSAMEETELTIHGRHDPCIVPRAVPVAEAVTAIVLLDLLYDNN